MSHIAQTTPHLSPNMLRGNGIVNKELPMMKLGNPDQVEGKLQDVDGKVKDVAGKLMNDPDLEADGKADEIPGKIKIKSDR